MGGPGSRPPARLARAGGQIAIEHWSRTQIARKADDSMVTDADLAIRFFSTRRSRALPDDGVLGEENSASPPRRALPRRRFYA